MKLIPAQPAQGLRSPSRLTAHERNADISCALYKGGLEEGVISYKIYTKGSTITRFMKLIPAQPAQGLRSPSRLTAHERNADISCALYKGGLEEGVISYKIYTKGSTITRFLKLIPVQTHFDIGCHTRIPTWNTILRWVASFRITGSTLKKKSPGRNSIALRLSEATVRSRALRLLSLGPFEGMEIYYSFVFNLDDTDMDELSGGVESEFEEEENAATGNSWSFEGVSTIINEGRERCEFQSLGRAIVKEDEYEEVRWDGIVSIVSWRERVFRLWWEER
ncbi:hypothetical protein ANN_25774 [Periplaneta americana]|uniref:Uncharacterized protein n=1 Tax=Periplaneta americana TaxID=6978 RepID=A0ABQ8S4I1_PERAM|nr:hypothetical protein ANN_25774 [Periplaneta americana]